MLGIDGAYVPTRPESARAPQGEARTRARRARWRGQWREAKGFRFYLLDGERIVHVLSWHQVQNEEQLGEARKQIKEAGLIPEDKVRLCVVCDGAEWIWKHVQALFPHARQVLDYYHCAQYLHRVAKAQYGASVQAVEWVEATMTRLYLGKVGVRPRGLETDAGAVRRSRKSDCQLLGLSQRASGADPLSPAPPWGLSVGQWGHGIVQQIHLSCPAQALGCLVV